MTKMPVARRRVKKPPPRDEADIGAFIEALHPVRPSWEGPYTYTDRYQDFSGVFATAPGRRVLRQIVDLGDKPVTEADLGSHDKLVWRAATRFVALKVIEWTTVPPRQE